MDTLTSLRQDMAAELQKRGKLALELEAQGKSWAAIGAVLGVSRQRAGQILNAMRPNAMKKRRHRRKPE
jgi:hypothetical protein